MAKSSECVAVALADVGAEDACSQTVTSSCPAELADATFGTLAAQWSSGSTSDAPTTAVGPCRRSRIVGCGIN